MARTKPFDEFTFEYDNWFFTNHFTYISELKAVKKLIPKKGQGLEIGVGTGRFAEPTGVTFGVEPSVKMAKIAAERKIQIVRSIAEYLPFKDFAFDFTLMVTTICFIDDVEQSFQEAKRVLKNGAPFLVGFIDKESPIGKLYQKLKNSSEFYKIANFYSFREIAEMLEKTGFRDLKSVQTVFRGLKEMDSEEEALEGHGKGSFVVLRAIK
ncbi:class I SAM-dependent methyltransferase [candidate division WOR-3 bacterium]|nr:class I SAM-dependent methyltransferase [candidate division WOR-3 bacterium]